MSAKFENRRAVAILRVSSGKQEENYSHETQESEIVRYCEEHGLALEKIERIVESAKDSDQRKEYSRVRDWAVKTGVLHILFYMFDRETRNLTDLETNEKLVRQGKIVLHYAKDRKIFDQNSSDSDFFLRDVQAATAKQYIRILGTKVNDALKTKAESGWLPQSHAPLGYIHKKPRDENGKELKRGSTIVPDPNKRNVEQVKREYALRADGKSLRDIWKQIIREGFIEPGKICQYHVSIIEKRLKNKFYRGYFDWKGKEYRGSHELIISAEVLRKVDASFGRKNFSQHQLEGQAVFAGGWLKCGNSDCGCNVVYDPKRKSIKGSADVRVYHFYHCTNGKRVHPTMKGMNVREAEIWKGFEGALDQISITEDFAKQIAEALNETQVKARSATKRETDSYREALKLLERKEDEAYDHFIKGILDKEAYQRQITKVRKERSEFTALLEQANLAITDAILETAKSILELASQAKSLWLSRAPAERRNLLDRILSNPVLEGATVRYNLKKPFIVLSGMKESGKWRGGRDSNPRPPA
jgi:site-specific DNA recombinase